jgi:hypothetical protein
MAPIFDDVFVVTYNKHRSVIPQLEFAFGVTLPQSHVLTRSSCTDKNVMFQHIVKLFRGLCRIVFVDNLSDNIRAARSISRVTPHEIKGNSGITSDDFFDIKSICTALRQQYPKEWIVLAIDFDETLTTGRPAEPYINQSIARCLLVPHSGVYSNAPEWGCSV